MQNSATMSLLRTTAMALSALAAATIAQADEPVVFIQNGEPVAVFTTDADWQTDQGYLASAAGAGDLTAGFGADAGDFRLSVRLAIFNLDRSAASFVLDHDNYFGFEGNTGTMFVEGPLFDSGTRTIGDTVIEDGVPFEFVVERRSQSIVFSIDGRVIHSFKAHDRRLGSLGFRPRRSRMAIESMTFQGATYEEEPPLQLVDVFLAGHDSYNTFRIPSVVTAPNGVLIAFAEGRRSNSGDSGDIDIVMRKSNDGGVTWGGLTVLADDGRNTCGNPCAVVDEDTHTIWLAYTRQLKSDDEAHINAGTSQGTRTVWMMKSPDGGTTWLPATQITESVKDPSWRWYATGPGVGIQIQVGANAGRLVIPCDHSYPTKGDDLALYDVGFGSHVIYSDDHGATWQRSQPVRPKVNECQVVELAGGELALNMRSYDGNHRRRVAHSTDGGATWSDYEEVYALVEPVCQASVARLTWPGLDGRSRILFSNPASTTRQRMAVRLSYDEGASWPVSKLVYRGPAAYSCLVALPDQSFGLLFEADEYARIAWAPLTLEWLTSGEDSIGAK